MAILLRALGLAMSASTLLSLNLHAQEPSLNELHSSVELKEMQDLKRPGSKIYLELGQEISIEAGATSLLIQKQSDDPNVKPDLVALSKRRTEKFGSIHTDRAYCELDLHPVSQITNTSVQAGARMEIIGILSVEERTKILNRAPSLHTSGLTPPKHTEFRTLTLLLKDKTFSSMTCHRLVTSGEGFSVGALQTEILGLLNLKLKTDEGASSKLNSRLGAPVRDAGNPDASQSGGTRRAY